MISTIVIGVGAAIVLLIILFFMSYVKARPDEVVLVSGVRKQPKVIRGRAGLRIPFLERADKLSLQLLNIDVKTANPVPTNDYINVTVDAVVTAKIGDDEKLIQAASQNFLNRDVEAIRAKIVDILEGNMREIVGQMQLVDLVSDRKQVSDNVLSNAKPDLERLGIVIQTFNIQNFRDEQGVIENLGVDKTSAIRKAAAISKANAERDILVAQSKAKREANDAAIDADLEIAKKQNGLAVAKADLKKQEDTKHAEADAAYEIQKQTQLKQINITAAEAEVAKQDKLIEVREKNVAVTQKELEAKVLKTAEAEKQATILRAEAAREAAIIQADANLYQTQKQSEAELFKQQKDAEADQYSKERDAEAQRYQQEQTAEGVKAMASANLEAAQADAKGIAAKGQAEGIAIRATGEAEAITIKAKGLSEAEALDKKADAMAKYGEAAKQDMQLEAAKTYFNVLPKIAGEIAKPMEKIGNITMYGEGNTAKLTGDITKTLTQITNGLTDGLGINPTNIINSMLAKKLPESNN